MASRRSPLEIPFDWTSEVGDYLIHAQGCKTQLSFYARIPTMNRMPKILNLAITAFALLFCFEIGASAAADSSRLKFDNECMTIDGKDMVIFSGAFHYYRCPKELWADRFRKLKEAGFNTVETYAAWNWQRPHRRPRIRMIIQKLDMTDLNDWLAMATDQFGFNVVLRPGPYICAEWDGGGFIRSGLSPGSFLPISPAASGTAAMMRRISPGANTGIRPLPK